MYGDLCEIDCRCIPGATCQSGKWERCVSSNTDVLAHIVFCAYNLNSLILVTTHPIAGTRKRGKTPEEDEALAKELLSNEKERAEHIMLVG